MSIAPAKNVITRRCDAKDSERSPSHFSLRILGAVTMLMVTFAGVAHSQSTNKSPGSDDINSAFSVASQGYSSDELLIRDDLRSRFLDELNKQHPLVDEKTVLLDLLKLRKAGKLSSRATKRGSVSIDPSTVAVAEIAARVVTDRHRVSTDVMLCDPNLRKELQEEAELLLGSVDAYEIRKSVLSLRKRRALRPELVLQVADWDRDVWTLPLAVLKTELENGSIPRQPGIYLFRGPEGYLYIGEAADLAERLEQHTEGSDRESLAEHLAGDDASKVTVELHIFPKDSPARRVIVRRAYESELIRSRHPKFNVRP